MMVHSSLQPGRHVHYCSRTPGDNHDHATDIMPDRHYLLFHRLPSWFRKMNGRSASQPATPPVSCTSMTIAVQLSGPPQVLARSTRRCAASSGDTSVRPVLRSDSETVPHSPSEQRRYRSPAHSSSDTTSTSTLAAVPSALVRMFRSLTFRA